MYKKILWFILVVFWELHLLDCKTSLDSTHAFIQSTNIYGAFTVNQSLFQVLGRVIYKADILPGAYMFVVENKKQRKHIPLLYEMEISA